MEQEIDANIIEQKKPEFVISSEFEFHKFSRKPDFCIAQSIFTHLNSRFNKSMPPQSRSVFKTWLLGLRHFL